MHYVQVGAYVLLALVGVALLIGGVEFFKDMFEEHDDARE